MCLIECNLLEVPTRQKNTTKVMCAICVVTNKLFEQLQCCIRNCHFSMRHEERNELPKNFSIYNITNWAVFVILMREREYLLSTWYCQRRTPNANRQTHINNILFSNCETRCTLHTFLKLIYELNDQMRSTRSTLREANIHTLVQTNNELKSKMQIVDELFNVRRNPLNRVKMK